MGEEVERAIIRVGGRLGCLSWQRGTQPPLLRQRLAYRVTGPVQGHSPPVPLY